MVDGWGGLPLNSPNDVVVKGDGTIWFTDPTYGFLQGFRPAPALGDFVYRHDPRTGEITVVAEGFDKPNGLAFSPDEGVLYVGDSGASTHRIEAFDVIDGHALTARRVFAVTTGLPRRHQGRRRRARLRRPGRPACRSSTPAATASARSPFPAPSTSPSPEPAASSSPRTPLSGPPTPDPPKEA